MYSAHSGFILETLDFCYLCLKDTDSSSGREFTLLYTEYILCPSVSGHQLKSLLSYLAFSLLLSLVFGVSLISSVSGMARDLGTVYTVDFGVLFHYGFFLFFGSSNPPTTFQLF